MQIYPPGDNYVIIQYFQRCRDMEIREWWLRIGLVGRWGPTSGWVWADVGSRHTGWARYSPGCDCLPSLEQSSINTGIYSNFLFICIIFTTGLYERLMVYWWNRGFITPCIFPRPSLAHPFFKTTVSFQIVLAFIFNVWRTSLQFLLCQLTIPFNAIVSTFNPTSKYSRFDFCFMDIQELNYPLLL